MAALIFGLLMALPIVWLMPMMCFPPQRTGLFMAATGLYLVVVLTAFAILG
jgi:hypothetical protein